MATALLYLITCLLLALAVAYAAEDTSATNQNLGKTMLTAEKITKDGCEKYCGSLLIPYPFGIGLNCSLNAFYSITCDNSTYNPPKAFLINTNSSQNTSEIQTPRRVHEIVNITETVIHVRNRVIYQCRNDTVKRLDKDGMILPIDSPFVFSNVTNQVISVGCGFSNSYQGDVEIASSARCTKLDEVKAGNCTKNNGCDAESFPRPVQEFNFSLSIPNPLASSFIRCGYGFIGDVSAFEFRGMVDTDDPLVFIDRIQKDVPLVIDWVIGNQTAYENNTECSDAGGGIAGYRCDCIPGFEGNPYLPPGCTERKSDECGVGKNKNGRGCDPKSDHMKLLIGLGLVLLGVAIAIVWIYIMIRKRRSIKMKEKLFTKNGGLLLKGQLSSMSQGGIEPIKIFTEKEIKIATNNFSDNNIAGRGSFGIVYKGLLEDNTLIAVKKARIIDEVQIEQFVNELVILSQVNHRNVVKLLGCCLEVEVPLLIYEFISNGALFDHIHRDSNEGHSLTWRECLRVISEIANALAYLHCSASSPIIHRDIKSANVLLDENYTAKISDFGASRLIPVDKTKHATAVQGTLGYLDPEYLFSSQLTEKSDIYSFGVLVAEILTGKKAVFCERGEYRNLAASFVELTRKGKVKKILDPKLIESGNMDEVMFVAEIVSNCLNSKGDKRPLMKDVAILFDRLVNQLQEDR